VKQCRVEARHLRRHEPLDITPRGVLILPQPVSLRPSPRRVCQLPRLHVRTHPSAVSLRVKPHYRAHTISHVISSTNWGDASLRSSGATCLAARATGSAITFK
jgi:hypothetical protein